MACGYSPNLALMLEQMTHEKEKKAHEAERALEATTQHVARVKQKTARAFDSSTSDDNTSYDWTKTYEKWDAWEDPEELARQEQDARARSERAAKAQMGCNHDHSAEQKLMDMTTREKLAACDDFRVLGNRFFRHGQYQRAAYHYHKALVYFEYIFPDSESEISDHDALKLKVLLNFAACRLKTEDIDDVIRYANQALAIEPGSVKALYRRAQAYRMRDDFEKAQLDITAALTTDGASDPLLLQERAVLQAKKLAYKLKSKQAATAMFPLATSRDAHASADLCNTRSANSNAGRLDASVLRPHLSASPAAGSNELASLESWQPSTFGLASLEAAITTLRERQQ